MAEELERYKLICMVKKKRARKYSFADAFETEEYFPSSDFIGNVKRLSSRFLSISTTYAPIKDAHLEIFATNQALLYKEAASRGSAAFRWIDLNVR